MLPGHVDTGGQFDQHFHHRPREQRDLIIAVAQRAEIEPYLLLVQSEPQCLLELPDVLCHLVARILTKENQCYLPAATLFDAHTQRSGLLDPPKCVDHQAKRGVFAPRSRRRAGIVVDVVDGAHGGLQDVVSLMARLDHREDGLRRYRPQQVGDVFFAGNRRVRDRRAIGVQAARPEISETVCP
ncbi:MAG: hypothetical protein HYU73_11760 [Betaproteobacteria bacterium]|nr:hypothetical protein [Betaproteobacteria bacterium]